MRAKRIILGAVTILLVCVSSVSSQELRYLGRDVGDARKGWIEIQGQYYEVVVGTVIPGWGTVTEVTDSHLITQHTLTEAEIENLRSQGAASYNVLQIEIPHEALRVVPIPRR